MRRNLKTIPVLDSDGNQLYTIPREAAVQYIRNGLAHAVFNKAIRFLEPASGPAFERFSGALNASDMEALANGSMSVGRRERLVGYFDAVDGV